MMNNPLTRSQVARTKEPHTSFDELIDTSFNFSTFVLNRLNIKDLTQEILVGPAFELLKGTCSMETTDKSYLDNRQKLLEFSIGDKLLLKVSPSKGVVRFGKRINLSQRYVGPFEIVELVSPIAYRLRLPQELVRVLDTFHVANMKKCLADVNLHVPLEKVKIDDKLHFVEEPMEIMEREVKKLKKTRIPIVKVRWNYRRGPEFTWEREDEMKCKYP
ncbi:hypothetical protein Tco_1478907 [Tanacetum coccineum]